MKQALEKIFGEARVKTDKDSIRQYSTDWTTYYDTSAQAVVFPQKTEEVQQLVRWANENKVPLVPSGGRTGLSGAAVGLGPEIIVSFERMNKVLDWDPIDRVITCQAGVVTEELQNFAKEKGYFFPVDFAARGSSQIGGNIATNAGGIRVLRYGLMRDWVASLEVVTGTGEVLRLNKALVKNATGYDLRQLFIGSEGTLGFITEASLKVTDAPVESSVLVLAAPGLQEVMQVFSRFRDDNSLTAFEFFSEKALQYVLAAGHVSKPFAEEGAFYVLLEGESPNEEAQEKLLSSFEACMDAEWVVGGTMSQSPTQAKELWRLREDISESISYRNPYKNDISVRISKVPALIAELEGIFAREYPDFEVIWFGHIGDGNIHINVLRPENMDRDEFVKECKRADEFVFSVIEKYEGSISAEHGVGLTKKPFLLKSRSAAEVELMKSIKKSFDPKGIINPGKLFDLP